MEQMEHMSQAQQIRSQAFFMAMQSSPQRFGGQDAEPIEAVLKRAEKLEEWLWKAEEDRILVTLVKAAERLLDMLNDKAVPTEEFEQRKIDLRVAIVPFQGAATKRR